MNSAEVKLGIYRHYKGHLYQVLGVAHDANYDDRKVVVYIGLELDAAHLGPRLAVRTLEDFLARVDVDGVEVARGAWFDGLMRERFEYLGPELTGDMVVV